MRPLPDLLPALTHRAERGAVTDRVLRGPSYVRLTRGTYQLTTDALTFETRLLAARDGLPDSAVLCGETAAWVYGVKWYTEATTPVELAMPHLSRVRRRPERIVRARTFHPDDVVDSPWGPITSPDRTAYDFARARSLLWSVPRLDALARASQIPPEGAILPGRDQPLGRVGPNGARFWLPSGNGGLNLDAIARIVERNHGARWLRRIPDVLDLLDAGAESPRESKLRVLLTFAGLPRLETQIAVFDGTRFAGRLDMGWRALRLAIEYDGIDHDNPVQMASDRARRNAVRACGWRIIVVDRAQFDRQDRLVDELVRAYRQTSAAARRR